jgi:hypothetical protein
MTNCTFYREIEYTIVDNNDGTWHWEILPSGPCSGDMDGSCKSRADAIAEAELAIDELLAIQPN